METTYRTPCLNWNMHIIEDENSNGYHILASRHRPFILRRYRYVKYLKVDKVVPVCVTSSASNLGDITTSSQLQYAFSPLQNNGHRQRVRKYNSVVLPHSQGKASGTAVAQRYSYKRTGRAQDRLGRAHVSIDPFCVLRSIEELTK